MYPTSVVVLVIYNPCRALDMQKHVRYLDSNSFGSALYHACHCGKPSILEWKNNYLAYHVSVRSFLRVGKCYVPESSSLSRAYLPSNFEPLTCLRNSHVLY